MVEVVNANRIIQEFKRNHLQKIKLHIKGDKFIPIQKTPEGLMPEEYFRRILDLRLLVEEEARPSYYAILALAFKSDNVALSAIEQIAEMMTEILSMAGDFDFPPNGNAPSYCQLALEEIRQELDALYHPYEYKPLAIQNWISKKEWDLHTAASILAGYEPGDWDNDIKYRLMLEFSNSLAGKIYQKAKQERSKYNNQSSRVKLIFKLHNKEKWIEWVINYGITELPIELHTIISCDQKEKISAKLINPFNQELEWHMSLSEAYNDFFKIYGKHPTAKPLKIFIQDNKQNNPDCFAAISFDEGKKDLLVRHDDTDKHIAYTTYENLVHKLRQANGITRRISKS